MTRYAAAFTPVLVLLDAGAAFCADLRPRTVAAFDRYVRVTEQHMSSDQEFLRIDGLLLERDGGTYVQCESISLTRDIPLGFGWLVRSFVTRIPRESLEFTLMTTRKALAQ